MRKWLAALLLILAALTQAIPARAVGYAVGVRCDQRAGHMVDFVVVFGPHGNIRSYPEPWAGGNPPLCTTYYRHHKRPKGR